MNKVTLTERLTKQSIFLGIVFSKVDALEKKCLNEYPDLYPDIFRLYGFMKDNIDDFYYGKEK
jgi:L-ribulose-5-phosphate 3-epimerase UlaE